MARRQLQIVGTQRIEHPAVEEAANKYREARDVRMEHTKREKQAKLMLIAVMQAANVNKYKFDDAEGEELLVAIDEKIDVKVSKTGEAESAIGEGVDSGEPHDDPGIHKGLIAQALQAQADAGVTEVDGDVVTPDSAAPKKGKRAKKAKP